MPAPSQALTRYRLDRTTIDKYDFPHCNSMAYTGNDEDGGIGYTTESEPDIGSLVVSKLKALLRLDRDS